MVLFKRNTPNKAAVGEGSKEANVKEEQKTTMKAPPSDPPSAKDKPSKKPTPKGEGSSSVKSRKNEVDPVVELRKRYDDFMKKLDTMIAAFKKRRELMIHCRKADNDVSDMVYFGSPRCYSETDSHVLPLASDFLSNDGVD